MCTFRVNYIKSSDNEIENILLKNNITYKKFDLLNTIYYLIDDDLKINLENLLEYKSGKIYIQNPSSMLPAVYLLDNEYIKNNINDNRNIDLLDMCAAPGGKTMTLQSLSNNYFNITAIEIDKKRYERMVFNFSNQNVRAYHKHISALDLDDFLKFDVILLDAPCTGCETNIDDVDNKYLKKLTNLQKKLLDKSIKLLKTNGILLYSTCSILDEEDEKQVDYINKNNQFKKIFEKKILPDDIYEGFYISIFQKVKL